MNCHECWVYQCPLLFDLQSEHLREWKLKSHASLPTNSLWSHSPSLVKGYVSSLDLGYREGNLIIWSNFVISRITKHLVKNNNLFIQYCCVGLSSDWQQWKMNAKIKVDLNFHSNLCIYLPFLPAWWWPDMPKRDVESILNKKIVVLH